jgi:hypothetical protein
MTALTNATGTVTTLAYINPGSGGTITPSVTVYKPSSGKEMLRVYFDASATTSTTTTNPEHELFYIWDFGDNKSTYYTNGVNTSQNKNTAYGPQAAHVYLTAGTFTPTCVILAGDGSTTTWTGTAITVVAWADADTIYINNGSTPVPGAGDVPAGVPSGNCFNETTWPGVLSRCASGKRVRLKKGAVWSASAHGNMGASAITAGQLDSYGSTGAAPLVNFSSAGSYNSAIAVRDSSEDVRIAGIKIDGVTPELVSPYGVFVPPSTNNVLLYQVEIANSVEAINTQDAISDFSVVECSVHDIGTANTSGAAGTFLYGAFIGKCYRLTFIGNNFTNNITGHSARLSGVNQGVIVNNTMHGGRHGYAGTYGHIITLRGFSNGGDLATFGGIYTEKVVICDNRLTEPTGCLDVLQIASQNTSDAARLRNIIVERNYMESNGDTRGLETECYGLLTVRNNILVSDLAPWGMRVISQSGVGAPGPTNTQIYNNTFWKKSASPDNRWTAIYLQRDTDSVSGVVIKNNLAYDALDTASVNGVGSGAAMIETSGTPVSYTESNNSTPTQIKNTKPWAATTPSAYADFAPNGYGINGGTSVPVIKDFFNATITGTRKIGAM